MKETCKDLSHKGGEQLGFDGGEVPMPHESCPGPRKGEGDPSHCAVCQFHVPTFACIHFAPPPQAHYFPPPSVDGRRRVEASAGALSPFHARALGARRTRVWGGVPSFQCCRTPPFFLLFCLWTNPTRPVCIMSLHTGNLIQAALQILSRT